MPSPPTPASPNGGSSTTSPNKQALLLGIHQHLAHNFDLALQKATGPDAEKASLLERTRAYVKASLASPHTVSLQLVLEATQEPDLLAPWAEVYQKWFSEEKSQSPN